MKPKFYRKCLNCKRVLVSDKAITGKQVATISRYPFCMPCFSQFADNPDFHKWIIGKLKGRKVIPLENIKI